MIPSDNHKEAQAHSPLSPAFLSCRG